MKPPQLKMEDYNSMVEQFHAESDRGAAVLAGSWAESVLGKYLEYKMIDSSLSHEIFSSNGPLSTFSQRISIGRAFGFLPQSTADSLTYIRKIRNHFAHHPLEASFDRSPVLELNRQLGKLLEKILNSYAGNNNNASKTAETVELKYTHKDVYLVSCAIFLMSSLSEMNNKKDNA